MRRRPSFLNIIYSRRTIRKFRKSTISNDILKMIVEAGQRAPCYYQTYSIIWISSFEKRQEIAALCEDELTKSMLLNASAVLLVCIDFNRFKRLLDILGHNHILREDRIPIEAVFALFEAGLVVENMCLAAEALGYGTAIVSYAIFECETISDMFNLPVGVIPLVFLCIGERGENPPLRPRWPIDVILHENNYNQITREKILSYLEETEKSYSEEGYLKKYAKWNGSYSDFLVEQTTVTKDIRKAYEAISHFLRKNLLRV